MPIHYYADGEWDGETIQCPTTDLSIITQRHMVRDMQLNPDLKITDSWTGRVLSVADYFDMHAMTLLVITEVDSRANDITGAVNDIITSNAAEPLKLGEYWRSA